MKSRKAKANSSKEKQVEKRSAFYNPPDTILAIIFAKKKKKERESQR